MNFRCGRPLDSSSAPATTRQTGGLSGPSDRNGTNRPKDDA